MWGSFEPRFEWRPSQQHILDVAATALADPGHDGRLHLCAPPGSGKTLLGLALAARLGRPALVLSPTVAVRDQWCEATALFGADPAAHTSTDPARPAPLLSVTYQLLGNPGQAGEELAAAARRLWIAEVARTHGDDAAEGRVAALEAADPKAASRERGTHVRRLRRALAGGEDLDLPAEDLLGPRAHALVEHLAGLGIGTLVLDECHHLLDWWALVVRALVERLGHPHVVGLTATLPDPDDPTEAANYRGLLGDVDVELALPALVAEGALAPWRDGVVLAALTDEERTFCDGWEERLAADLDETLRSVAFVRWAVATVAEPALDEQARPPGAGAAAGDAGPWQSFWDRDPLVAAALARWWHARGQALPAGIDAPGLAGAGGPLTVDDRLLLVDAWLHDPAAAIGTEERAALRSTLEGYGIAVTTGGVRRGRSVVDLVCSRSAAKGSAAAGVVAAELRRRGEGCRALVVVERDRASTPPAAAREVLGEDPGTAARVLAQLLADRTVLDAGVVAVTGRGAWVDAVHADAALHALRVGGFDAGAEGAGIERAVRLAGRGPGWTSGRWLAAAGTLLDVGECRTLLATRALVGEGWDHPGLNVLVDLSEAASRTAATQLRGRAIRLDRADPSKLASLWDVVALHPGGRAEWDRARRRHAHWWGPDAEGRVRTGAAKVHAALASSAPPTADAVAAVNAESAAAVADVEATRAAWAALDPAGIPAPTLEVAARRRRSVGVQLRWSARDRGTVAAGGLAGGLGGVGAGIAAGTAAAALTGLGGIAVGVAAGAALLRRRRRRATEEVLLLVALGEATRDALCAAGRAVPAGAPVGLEPAGDGHRLALQADEVAGAIWADALAEVLGPVGSPRWLVAAGERAWRVPTAVGATRAAAEAFAAALGRRVDGVRLHRAGTPEATTVVLREASVRPAPVARSSAWR